jgi:predicted metal-dependent RNase
MADERTTDSSMQHDPEEPVDGLLDQSLVDLMIRLRGLPDELSAATVPERLMVIPIGCAMDWLDQHRRECRRPKMCPHTPGPLRMLLTVHSREAVLAAAGRIHAELWRAPESMMVDQVRERILEHEADLVDTLDDLTSLTGEELDTAFQGDGDEDSVLRTAGVLWALGLAEPEQRRLFRLLPIFLPPDHDRPQPPPHPPREGPSEKERHKRRREAAEARVIELEGEIRDLKEKARRRAVELASTKTDLGRATAERDSERGVAAALGAAQQDLLERVRGLETELRENRTAAQRSQQEAARLRQELDQIRESLDRAERERGHLTRELALSRTEVESLRAALKAVPRGKDAIAAFLAEEEERIDQDLTILQGGDRAHAELEHARREKLEAAFREAYPEYVPPRPTSVGPPRTLQFTALGGGTEVGRSAYLIEVGPSKVLVDCGIAVGRREIAEMVPNLDGLGSLDAIVLTHAHTDHIGWLPALVRTQDPTVPIYCSEDTADITPIMLDDSRGHYERMLARGQLIAAHNPEASPPIEQYTRDDLYDVETRLHALRYDEPLDIPGTALRLTLFPAGHILGAASVLLEGGGRRIMVSGDISSEHQATVGPASPPRDLSDVDLLVLESTYGGRTRDSAASRQELVEFVRQTTEHGTALLPCFALGRGQEVIQLLQQAQREGQVDPSITIWVDGLIRRILPFYIERERVDPTGHQLIGPGEREFVIAQCQRSDERAIVVTTSGMLNGGPIIEWAEALLPDSRHRIALLGYQDEGAAGGVLARQLREGRRPPYDLTLPREEGDEVCLRIASQIREIGLSAHADQNGLVAFASAISPRRVVLVHGDPRAQAALANKLSGVLSGTTVTMSGSEPLIIA